VAGRVLLWQSDGTLGNASVSDLFDLIAANGPTANKYYLDVSEVTAGIEAVTATGSQETLAVTTPVTASSSIGAISGTGTLGAVTVSVGASAQSSIDAVSGTGSLGAVVATGSTAAVSVTDNFNRSGFNDNSDWTAISGLNIPGISSNKAIGVSGGGGAYWSGDTIAVNQYAQAVVSAALPGNDVSAYNSVAVRVSGTNRYELRATQLYYDDPDFFRFWVIALYKNGTLVATFEDSTVGCDTARTLRIEATGTSTTQIVCKVDGATVDTRNDSSSPNTTGAPGLILAGADYNLALADDFAAGDL
jgi:hypothetical protein